MTAIAIIPARGGSRRIPGKNIKLFHGQPIILYSVSAALHSGLFNEVYVSTDNLDILRVCEASSYDVTVIERDPKLAHDSVGTQEVVRDALTAVPKTDYVCCIYATAPLMTVEDLKDGYDILISNFTRYSTHPPVPYVYTVGPDYQDAGQWYWGTYRAFVEGVSLDEGALYRLPPERTCDINTPEDWARAEQLYKDMHV